MTLSRRRFLCIAASFGALPQRGQAQSWTGQAFGGEVSITLRGPSANVTQALSDARALMAKLEAQFSLYNPKSDLVRLNREGRLSHPTSEFLQLLQSADDAYQQTGGLFDPTVQPLWTALHADNDPHEVAHLVGWDRVTVTTDQITLAPGQALTLNGIAQGFVTDRVSDLLAKLGFRHVLVNIGEFRGTGEPWHLGVEDPSHGLLATRRLVDGAIATSSPLATQLIPTGHIVHPTALPRWSTVSVEADTAVMADALSTGLTMADMGVLKAVRASKGVRRITLVDHAGDLTTL